MTATAVGQRRPNIEKMRRSLRRRGAALTTTLVGGSLDGVTLPGAVREPLAIPTDRDGNWACFGADGNNAVDVAVYKPDGLGRLVFSHLMPHEVAS